MSQVLRYTPSLKPGLMIEDAEGKWAKYEVLAQVVAECGAAKETLERWHELNLQREAKMEALQQRLTAADERADVLEGLVGEVLDAVGREPLDLDAVLRLRARMRVALKPAEGGGDDA